MRGSLSAGGLKQAAGKERLLSASKTDLVRAMGEVHADNVKASWFRSVGTLCEARVCCLPLLSMEIFSAELVFGPGQSGSVKQSFDECKLDLTNCADDGGAAVILLRLVLGVEVGAPFKLRPVGQVVECVAHTETLFEYLGIELGVRMDVEVARAVALT